MKKFLSIILILICITLTGCTKKSMTIEEITGINFNEIDHIKTGDAWSQNENYDVNKFINEYKNLKYKKFKEGTGSTAHTYYVCYNSDNEVLFTLVDIGNQGKYFIKKGSFDINKDSSNRYQLAE